MFLSSRQLPILMLGCLLVRKFAIALGLDLAESAAQLYKNLIRFIKIETPTVIRSPPQTDSARETPSRS